MPVEIGQTLAFLIVILGIMSLSGGGGLVWLAIVVAMILLTIYLHELGHAWASLVQGVPVRRIVLHGGGGFCEQARSASAYEQEFIVAMGPIVNLGLWALTTLLTDWLWKNGMGGGYAGHYLSLFAWLNLMFFFLNMIPAQPLDGGRLLHLVLLRFLAPPVAMRLVGGVGLIFAVRWWPARLFIWITSGWLLLFVPSIALHYRMMRGAYRV